MPSLHDSPSAQTSRHAQNATATHVLSVSQASPSGHSSWVRHGSPLPPFCSNGVHVGTASPLAGAGQAASGPSQNGPHTDAPGSWIGAVPLGQVPPSSVGGYDGSSGPPSDVLSSVPSVVSPPLVSLVVSTPLVLDSSTPLVVESAVIVSSLVPTVAVPVVSAMPSSSPSSSPPHATTSTHVTSTLAHEPSHEPIRMLRTHVIVPARTRVASLFAAFVGHRLGVRSVAMSEPDAILELRASDPARLANAVHAVVLADQEHAARLRAGAEQSVAERPTDRAIAVRFQTMLELGYLVASADGFADAERSSLARLLESITGSVVDRVALERHFRDLDAAVAALGRRERLARLAAELDDHVARVEAVRLAALIAMADGRLGGAELGVLLELGGHLAISEDLIRNLVGAVAERVKAELQ